MAARVYTIIDFTPPPGLWPDRDRVVRFMEYVRANFERLVQGVPPGCEVDLFAGGPSHNTGLVPLLGIWAPPTLLAQVPDPWQMIDDVSSWCAGLFGDEIDAIIATTKSLTWEELVRFQIYPPRKDET
jgi:hypothetical protein